MGESDSLAVGRVDPAHRSRSEPAAWGALLVIAGAALFAINGTTGKLILDSGLESADLAQIRVLASTLCFLAVALVRSPHTLAIRRGELARLAVLGVIGIAMVQWMFLIAIDRLPAGIALLLEFLAPVFVVLWVRFVRREPVRPVMWPALGLCLLGLAFVAGVIGGGVELDGLGVLAALTCAVALATYYLLGERVLATRDPIGMSVWTFAAAAVFWLIVRPPWLFPFGALDTSVRLPDPFGFSVPVWVLIGWLVVLGTVAPYVLILQGLRRIGPARTGLVGMVEPVFTAAVAWYLLDQSLTGLQIAGGAIVLGGVALAESARRPQAVQPAAVMD